MNTLSAVVSELNPSTAESIHAIEKDGGCFLRCFNSFSDADLLGIISNPSFVEYVKNTIMKAEEESEVRVLLVFLRTGSPKRDIVSLLLHRICQQRYSVLCCLPNPVYSVFLSESLF